MVRDEPTSVRRARGADPSSVEQYRSGDEAGAEGRDGTDRRTLLTTAVGLVASTGLAGCAIQADSGGIEVDFGGDDGSDPTEEDDGDGDDPDESTSGDTGTPTADSDDGGDAETEPTDTASPTPSPTPEPVDLRESLVTMSLAYDAVTDKFGSAAAEYVSDAAMDAVDGHIWESSAEYLAFMEDMLSPQYEVHSELSGSATQSSFDAYGAALGDLKDAVAAGADIDIVAGAQNNVSVAAGKLERA